jgi:hypothetical protein
VHFILILIRFYVGTSVLKVVKFVIVPSLPPLPLSVKVGAVSPSPHLHQDKGERLLISFGTPD